MELSQQHKDILKGLVCPYCKDKTELVSSKIIYGQDFGFVYYCEPCDAYVGCHAGTDIALGRLANKELRKAKKEAHRFFDMIWKLKIMNRDQAYAWLSTKLNLPKEYTHIGMIGHKTCKDVVYYSKQFLNDNRRLDMDFGTEPLTQHFEF